MLKAIRSSCRLDKSIIWIILIDAATILSVTFLIAYFGIVLEKSSLSLNMPEHVFELSEAELFQLSESIGSYYSFFITALIVFLLASFAILSLTRAIVWAITLKGKISTMYVLKSILLGLPWFFAAGLPFIAIIYTFNPSITEISSVIYVAIVAYFSMHMFMLYAETGKFVWLKALSSGIKRYDMLAAFAILALVYYALYQPLNTLMEASLPGLVAGSIIVLLYFAWSRKLLSEIKKRG